MTTKNEENMTEAEAQPVEADELLTEEALEGVKEEQGEELSIEALQQALELAQEEAAKSKDQGLRALADAQNVKRRAEKDVENARKFGQEKLITELLPVIDNLERAVGAADADNEQLKPVLDGIELTMKSFFSALEKVNVVAIDPQGEPFDPQLHQAMSMVENAEVEPNSVIAVMQKGYSLNGRLIRPAMVMVSKAAPSVDEQA